jgi:hypothetical protein
MWRRLTRWVAPLRWATPTGAVCPARAPSENAETYTAGTRQVATGLAELERRNGKILCTSMCIGLGKHPDSVGATRILIFVCRYGSVE